MANRCFKYLLFFNIDMEKLEAIVTEEEDKLKVICGVKSTYLGLASCSLYFAAVGISVGYNLHQIANDSNFILAGGLLGSMLGFDILKGIEYMKNHNMPASYIYKSDFTD